MRCKLILMAIAVGLALPRAAQAQATQPAGSVMVWKIRCTGISSVPFTADQAQGLPLQIVGTLTCGEEVSVLSDAEGYTVRIRTADGKTGYVASMNLAHVAVAVVPPAQPKPVPAPPRVIPASAELRNGVARWRRGAQGCLESTKDGGVVESLTVSGVTVKVLLHDAGAKLRADVAIENVSPLYVYVNPIGITLETRGEHLKSLRLQTPAELANEMAPQAPAGPQAEGAAYKAPDDTSLFPTVTYIPPRQATEDAPAEPQVNQAVVEMAKRLTAESLKKGVLPPDGKSSGAVWFERDETPGQYVMRVPIENQVFEFPLSLAQAK